MNASHDFAPLYYKIKQDILNQIGDHALGAGDLLPSEAQLSAQYNVSRITVRHAINDLIQQGVLFSLRGKGTFVAHAPIREMSGFRSFSEDIIAKWLRPSSRVLRLTQAPASAEVAAHLHIQPGEPVHQLERIRLADDQPVAIETAYLPVSLFPNLNHFDFSGSLYTVLREQYGVHPAWADAEIQAITATPEVAQALGMHAGEPVLIAHRLTYTEAFHVVEYVVSVYCGSRFTFYTGRQSIA